MYTMDDWLRDRVFNPEIDEEMDVEVINEMRDCVPPHTMTKNILQVGEPWSHDYTGEALYTTFERIGGRWIYTGHKPSMRIGWR